jgi:excisionase family DNA binding protein
MTLGYTLNAEKGRIMKYLYQAIFEVTDDCIEVHFPDLQGCRTFGRDLNDAAEMASDALATMISHLVKVGEALPDAVFDHKAPNNGFAILVSVDALVPEDETMTVTEAADILGVSPRRINAMIGDGILTAVKAGRDNMVTTASVKERFNNPRKAGRPRKELVGT